MRFRVYYNVHPFPDGSGPAMSRNRIVEADCEEEARERVRMMEFVGCRPKRYIGMVHQAEPVEANP